MQNALRTGAAGTPTRSSPTTPRPLGRTAWLGTGQPAQTSGQRWRAFALLVVAYVVNFGLIRRRQKAFTVAAAPEPCASPYFVVSLGLLGIAAALGVGPNRGPASCGTGTEACPQARR
jgi:hypothetical protein